MMAPESSVTAARTARYEWFDKQVDADGSRQKTGTAIVHAHSTCPVKTFGHAGTNRGRTAGHDLLLISVNLWHGGGLANLKRVHNLCPSLCEYA